MQSLRLNSHCPRTRPARPDRTTQSEGITLRITKTMSTLLSAAGFSLLLSGCGGQTAGEAQPISTPASNTPNSTDPAPPSATGSSTENLAPTVTDPKDIVDVSPCDFLTADQAASFQLPTTGEQAEDNFGYNTCLWSDLNTGFSVAIYHNSRGITLSDIYEQQDTFAVFQPLDIAGHPATVANRVDSDINCEVFLAATDDQMLVLQTSTMSNSGVDACDWGIEIAATAIENVPD